jgi:hypothetical protein
MKKLFFLLSTVFVFSGVVSAQSTLSTVYVDVSESPDWNGINNFSFMYVYINGSFDYYNSDNIAEVAPGIYEITLNYAQTLVSTLRIVVFPVGGDGTGSFTLAAGQNCLKLTNGFFEPATYPYASYTVSLLGVSENGTYYKNQEIELSAESTEVDIPYYTYWVVDSEGTSSKIERDAYTPTEVGTYCFSVKVAEENEPDNVLAISNEICVNVGRNTGLTQTAIGGDDAITSGSSVIQAQFEGTAVIELYTISGALLTKTTAVGSFEQTGLATGLYIIKINGQATKVAVK